ncbi:hypothetical protein ADK41_24190 [Streptomyces caelestis]|uniref:Lipoprotein n=2 Tax=Streptomyces TaxID=1883 RepID=A0A0M8QGT6_9ACTN|nr:MULTISPECIES: hypothetical protein [Streptomyces]KOT35817.1 hypothetical protein ADK41_24190 [Streptomyces caelestis]KOV32106.1 hypothetical protein ADK58_06565 [Streptomyces sp. XY152]
MRVDGLRRVPAAVAMLAAAALLAGCGGGDEGSADGGSGAAAEGSSKGAPAGQAGGGPLDAAGLESAAVTETDLPDYTFTVFKQGTVLGGKGEPADPAVCQPIEDIRLRSPEPAPAAAAARSVHPNTDVQETEIALYAYDKAADAEELLTRVREAAKNCPAGYEDDTGLNPTVTALADPDPGPGDEAVAYRRELSGTAHWYRVVRSGPHVAVFGWKSMVAHKNAGEAPAEVITAQLKKLTEAAGTG